MVKYLKPFFSIYLPRFICNFVDDKSLPKIQRKDPFSHSMSPQPKKSYSSTLFSSTTDVSDILSSEVTKKETQASVSNETLKLPVIVNRVIEKNSIKPSIKERLSEKVVTTILPSSLSNSKKRIESSKSSRSKEPKADCLQSSHRKISTTIANKDIPEINSKVCSEQKIETSIKDKKSDKSNNTETMNDSITSNTHSTKTKRKHKLITYDLDDKDKDTSPHTKKLRDDKIQESNSLNKLQKKPIFSTNEDSKFISNHSFSTEERRSSEEEDKPELKQQRKIYIRNSCEIKKYDNLPSSCKYLK